MCWRTAAKNEMCVLYSALVSIDYKYIKYLNIRRPTRKSVYIPIYYTIYTYSVYRVGIINTLYYYYYYYHHLEWKKKCVKKKKTHSHTQKATTHFYVFILINVLRGINMDLSSCHSRRNHIIIILYMYTGCPAKIFWIT